MKTLNFCRILLSILVSMVGIVKIVVSSIIPIWKTNESVYGLETTLSKSDRVVILNLKASWVYPRSFLHYKCLLGNY